ncbi:MAG: hypothetical protein U0165_05675 [Polyangiaceae bacterium]
MDARLKDVLRRLVDKRDEKLSDEDIAIIEKSIGKPQRLDDSSPRPLWYFIRERAFLWKQVLELPLDWLMGDIDSLLSDAGATKRPTTPAERLDTEITREGLVRAVKKHLDNNNNTTTRAYAALLIGLAKLDELLPLAAEAISTGREERQSWGQPVIGAYLETLAMSRHPDGYTLASRYVGHEDDRIRRAAQVNALLHASEQSDSDLAHALEHTVANWVLLSFPDEVVRAARGGLDLESKLQSVLGATWRMGDYRMIARIALKAELQSFVEELLEHGNGDVKYAAMLEAIALGAKWTSDKINSDFENEGDEYAQAIMVVALSSFDREKKSWLKSMLTSDRRGDKIGAAWASVFMGGNDEELTELAKDTDDDVRKAALAALMMRSKERSAELIELRAREALRHWSTAIQEVVGTVFSLAGHTPDCVRDARFFRDEVPSWRSSDLDEMREFYAKRPAMLMNRMTSESTPSDMVRQRAYTLAGLLGGSAFNTSIERRLADCRGFSDALALFLEARCFGGPRTDLGKVAGRLVLGEAEHPIDLTEDELSPSVVWAFGGDSQIASRAISNLARFEKRPSFVHLLPFLSSTDDSAGKAVSSAVAQLANPVDPLLSDAAALLSGAVKRLADLEYLDLLASAGAAPVRAKVAEVAGLDTNDFEHVKGYLVLLAADQNADVALAALGSLAARAGHEGWVQRLLLDTSRSDNWQTSRQSLDIMARHPAGLYLPRLLDVIANSKDDTDLAGRAVRAIEAIADKFPEHGLVVLDIREPRRVDERYGLGGNFDWSADQRTEALRLLMIALERRKDASAVEKAKGRKLLLCRPQDAPAGGRHLTSNEFEAIALHLTVTFTDEDTGTVVAEVGDEPTGEVLNALLQTDSVVVSGVFWS